jgi:hypothetical protein
MSHHPHRKTTGVMAASLEARPRGVMTPPFAQEGRHLFSMWPEDLADRDFHADLRLTLWCVAVTIGIVIVLEHVASQ